METGVIADRKQLFLRLSIVLFFAELAHGMLLYGILPELISGKFAESAVLFGFMPVKAVQLAGFGLAAYTLAELLFKLPAGHQVDHKGPDGALRFALILSLVSVPLIILAPNPNIVIVGCVVHGLGASAVWPAVISAWTRGRSAHERGEIMGQILSGWMAGLGAGVILGNFLVGFTGRAELVATYAPLALWAVAVVAAFAGKRLGLPAHHCGADGEPQTVLQFRFPAALRTMGIGLFIQNLAFGCLILTFREVAVEHLFPPTSKGDTASAWQFGLLLLVGGGPAVGLMGPMGKLSDRVGRRKSVIYSMLIVAPLITIAPFLSYLPVSPWTRFAIMVPGLIIAGVAYAFMLPAWHALALGRIAEQHRGRSLAILMSLEMAALAGGHLVGPSLYARVGFWAPFVLAGGTFGIMAILYALGFILPRETHDEPNPAEAEIELQETFNTLPMMDDPDINGHAPNGRVPQPESEV